jgi:hypothetical protein
MPKGLTPGQFGDWAGPEPVGRQSPGSMPGTYGVLSSAPSLARAMIIACAAALPTTSPFVTFAEDGIAAISALRSAAINAACDGNATTSVSCAACAMAALTDVPGADGTETRYGRCVEGSIELTAS